jgi:nucleotide-binding universal stress UspA family protein
MFKNVLIATDGSELAEKAVQQGLAVAAVMKAKVTVVRATPVPRMYVAEGIVMTPPVEVHEQVSKVVADQFTRIKQEAGASGVQCETVHVENDAAWQAILDTAKDKRCDLIVMASHGRTGFSAAFLGSETHKVLAQSTVPVLVCR